MEIDHLFVFSANQGQEANELLEFGFVEGSSRVHMGQGTTNRKFYFDNFFLELLWVIDEQEVTSELVAPTKLWE
ncbi:VOC family protein [Spirosoma oryzicola]|uniref:VOC family protein n=1 Tax=Spirosoma oryzicola TaxID=2898794 RepID=UPI001E3D0134|nr:VOC family protein [Spirosoma oryzicola]UHG94724.1 VOC family protein [Spirosoma oryzicola]